MFNYNYFKLNVFAIHIINFFIHEMKVSMAFIFASQEA